MVDAEKLLAKLRSLGFTLSAEGKCVNISPAPAGWIIARIKDSHTDLLKLLCENTKEPAAAPDKRMYSVEELLLTEIISFRVKPRLARDGKSIEIFGRDRNVNAFLDECGPSLERHKKEIASLLAAMGARVQ